MKGVQNSQLNLRDEFHPQKNLKILIDVVHSLQRGNKSNQKDLDLHQGNSLRHPEDQNQEAQLKGNLHLLEDQLVLKEDQLVLKEDPRVLREDQLALKEDPKVLREDVLQQERAHLLEKDHLPGRAHLVKDHQQEKVPLAEDRLQEKAPLVEEDLQQEREAQADKIHQENYLN